MPGRKHMQKRYQIVEGRVAESAEDTAPIIVFSCPDTDEKRYMTECLKIDEHTLASALDPDELSRLEFEPEHVAMIVKRPKNYSGAEQFMFRVNSMGIFLFKDRLIVVVADNDPLFEGKPFIALHSLVDVALKLIYRSIFHFLEHLKVINMVTDELEDKINASMENRFLINLFSLEKSLVYYLNAIHTNGVLITKIRANMNKMGIDVQQSEYLDDITVENDQCYKLAEIYSNVLSGLMDARVSIVSNNLNVIMKTLTIITLGIMLPTFVVSSFSMNVPMPLSKESPVTFWLIMGLAFVSGAIALVYWRYKKFW
jgi:magnesium transporter